MQQEFAPLHEILQQGGSVIIPARRDAEHEGFIKHNLGTGFAKLPKAYQEIIQVEIDKLSTIATETEWSPYIIIPS